MLDNLHAMRGKRALITGASAGIGRACAISLAQCGMNLVLTGRKVVELEAVAQECRDKGVNVVTLAGDLNDKPFVRQLAKTAHDADVFVNNAGILYYAPLLDMPVEECEQMFATNVIACYDISREVAQHMVARGGGQMIFVTSGSARNVGMHAVVYAATKHAVSAFAKGFRLELKSANVRVTEIAPGMVDTDMRKGITHPEVLKALAARPFKPISAQDVADGVVYAVSCKPSNSPDLIELRPPRA
jgi:3-hydroxy acid dehydrogenase/malonic semialdehyde reductase